ncbi:MAG TPA: NAD(P)-dependent oxidoreductase [Polyangiaceae bacterium]
MSSQLAILVTGATGLLGTELCRTLVAAGHKVCAMDRKFIPDFPARVVLGDLLDEHCAYRAMDGCDAVVHLGNHPNMFVGPSAQQMLADNVRSNANVFWAATQLGIRNIVFASSVQVMLRAVGGHREPPYVLPYLPLDSSAPRDPGTNTYAFSKEVGERALELLCTENPDLAATSLRFPMLPRPQWVEQLRNTRLASPLRTNANECFTHLTLADAAELIHKVLLRPRPGYRQYFPAWSIQFRGVSPADLYRQFFSHATLRRPLEELTDFADISDLKRDLDWEPRDRIIVELDPNWRRVER